MSGWGDLLLREALNDETPPDLGFSEESLFGGRLVCRQHRKGYRFSIDAVLLAHFAKINDRDRVLELGAGCGIISLAMAYRNPSAMITAVEIQPQLVELIRDNVRRNGYDNRITVQEGDFRNVREYLTPGAFDAVVVNPPYRVPEKGRPVADDERAIARQELRGGLGYVVQAAFWALRERGRATFVFPADRVTTLLSVLRGHRLEPKRLRVVHGYPGSNGKLVLVESVKLGGEGMTILPPLNIYVKRGGEYTDEVCRMYAEGEGDVEVV